MKGYEESNKRRLFSLPVYSSSTLVCMARDVSSIVFWQTLIETREAERHVRVRIIGSGRRMVPACALCIKRARVAAGRKSDRGWKRKDL